MRLFVALFLLHRHRGLRRVFAYFLAAARVAFRPRLKLMDAPLLLDDRSVGAALRRLLAPLAAAIALAAVAPAAITTSPPMFVTLAFGSSAFALRTITSWLLLPVVGGLALLLWGLALLLCGLPLCMRLRAFASDRMELRRVA